MPDVSSSQRILSKAYADSQRNKPAQTKVPMTGMASGRTDRGMRQGSAFKTPDVTKEGDYMGMAFDAAVRKGKDASRAYLLAKMKRDGRSDAFIQGKLKEFDDSIGKQRSLKADQGLGEGIETVYRQAAENKKQPTFEQAKNIRDAQKRLEPFTKLEARIGNAVGNAIKKVPSVMGRQENIPF